MADENNQGASVQDGPTQESQVQDAAPAQDGAPGGRRGGVLY